MDPADRYPDLRKLPRVDLGVKPTAVEEHRIAGLTVLVKRDDLTSLLVGGNKVRCLEHLLSRPAARLLTFSTLSAHHAFATAVCGQELGLPTTAVIVRKGERGEAMTRLPELCAEVVEVDGIPAAVLAAARRWRRGTNIIPPGGVSARGALGYLEAALEIDEMPRRIYVPLGSGTTVSGLLAGLMLRGAETEVVAVRVADAFVAWPRILWGRARRAIALLRRHVPDLPAPAPGGVRLRVVKSDGAYGEPTPTAVAAVRAARPLRLENTYTGKTLAVLLSEKADGAMFLNTYAPPGRPASPAASQVRLPP